MSYSALWITCQASIYFLELVEILKGVRKGSSFCVTAARKRQNLRPAACKVMILRLRHHQDSQVAIYINTKL